MPTSASTASKLMVNFGVTVSPAAFRAAVVLVVLVVLDVALIVALTN